MTKVRSVKKETFSCFPRNNREIIKGTFSEKSCRTESFNTAFFVKMISDVVVLNNSIEKTPVPVLIILFDVERKRKH